MNLSCCYALMIIYIIENINIACVDIAENHIHTLLNKIFKKWTMKKLNHFFFVIVINLIVINIKNRKFLRISFHYLSEFLK